MPSMQHRQSNLSNFSRYTDQPSPMPEQQQTIGGSIFNITNTSDQALRGPYSSRSPGIQSTDNLIYDARGATPSPPPNRAGFGGSSVGFGPSRPTSTLNFQQHLTGHADVSDAMIIETIQACLNSVDLDSVTKKQLKALAEQRLQVQLSAERRTFLDQQIDNELANM